MPELPEVETIAASLRKEVAGAVIRDIRITHRSYVRFPRGSNLEALRGKSIGEVRRHGKRLMIDFHAGGSLICHLGMTGRILVLPAAAPSAAHTHLLLVLDDGAREIRFRDPRRFGGVWYREAGAPPPPLQALGPDALSVSLPRFREILKRERQIKALLMDQSVLSGLGNIYCDEALFAARIHPQTKASRISAARVALLHREMRRILKAAIRHRGSTVRDYATVQGDSGGFQAKHLAYGREGEPCPRCRMKIRRMQAAGRSTHVCPRCQKLLKSLPKAKASRSREGGGTRSRPRRGSPKSAPSPASSRRSRR
jgi:formamidopyrimidine-DNA glycosylase